MPQTVTQLAERVRRKLGVALIPQSSSSPDAQTYSLQQLGQRTLRELGILVPEANRPAPLPAAVLADLAARTLRAVGLSPLAQTDAIATSGATVTVTEIAARSLRAVGVSPFGPLLAPTEGTFTDTQIATEVLVRLGVIDPSETPTAANVTEAVLAVDGVVNALSRVGVINFASNAIPGHASPYITIMAMQVAAAAFGKPISSLDTYLQAENKLREQALSGADGQQRAESQVAAVHDRLSALNLVNWPATAIPQYAVEAYVSLTAAALVPVHSSPASSGTISAAAPAATREQLVEASLASGETAIKTLRSFVYSGAYGQAIAEAKLSTVHDELNAMGWVSWPVTAVPAAFAEDYVTLAAAALAPDVGIAQDPGSLQAGQAVLDAARARIKRAAEVSGAEALVEDRIQAAHAELTASNLVSWDLGAVPAYVADAYVQMARNTAAVSFGGDMDPKAYEMAKQRVRMAVMGGPAGLAVAQQKVLVVHATLDALGKTRWSIFDLPDYVEEPYVLMAASLAAPEFNVKSDPAWPQQAMLTIDAVISVPATDAPVRVCYF